MMKLIQITIACVASQMLFTMLGADALQLEEQIKEIDQFNAELSSSPLRKVDFNLAVRVSKLQRGGVSKLDRVSRLFSAVRATNDCELIDCNIKAVVSQRLIELIEANNGIVVSVSKKYGAIHAKVPLGAIEKLANDNDVHRIQRVLKSRTLKANTSEADIAHKASSARLSYNVSGRGIKVGVMSDSARYLSEVQARGDLPDVCVLAGYEGVKYDDYKRRVDTGEGTAMLEIVHDLAPDAELYFATGFGTLEEFAEAVDKLKEKGCQIIVDDVGKAADSTLQDGIIASAINDFSDTGGIYLSSAGNSGNVDFFRSVYPNNSFAGVWEGDFQFDHSNDGYDYHKFGDSLKNRIVVPSSLLLLQWSDPWDHSNNNYDLYIVDENMNVQAKSCDVQDGREGCCPFEGIDLEEWGLDLGSSDYYVVIVKKSNAAARYLRLDAWEGVLLQGTDGMTAGHCAAEKAITVAAAHTVTNRAFVSTDPMEGFSSDGPRKIFFNQDGSAVTANKFLSSGGTSRLKPEITGADGVVCLTPGFEHFTGTSAAAPHAAAIAALMLEANPDLKRDDVMEIFKKSTFSGPNATWNRTSGYGILNAEECVRLAVESAKKTPAPTDLSARQNANPLSVTLSWQHPEEDATFYVYKNTKNEMPATWFTKVIGETVVGWGGTKDTEVQYNTTYYYWVVAQSADTTYASSVPTKTQITLGSEPLPLPPAPEVTVTVTDKIRLSWESVGDVHGYYIYRGTDASSRPKFHYKDILAVGEVPDVFEFVDEEAVEGATYYYWVVAYRGATKGNFAGPFEAILPSTTGKPDLTFRSGAGWAKPLFLSTVQNAEGGCEWATEIKSTDTVYFNVAVWNAGTADCTTPFTTVIAVYDSKEKYVTGFEFTNTESYQTLTAGGNGYRWRNYDWSGLAGLPPGTYTLTCEIDSAHVVAESNEGNNSASFVFTVAPTGAYTYYVKSNGGNDGNNGSSASSAFASIQKAINVANDGDTIWVYDGTYAPIATGNRRITIRSINGAGVTMIDGAAQYRCALLGSQYGETNTVLSGFALINGMEYNGGGAFGGTLEDCILVQNTSLSEANDGSDGLGGGACCSVLNRCYLAWNAARYGAGAYKCILNNCLIGENEASLFGGAAYDSALNNCTVVGNEAKNYAGGCCYGELNNCIVWDNQAGLGSNAVWGATCRYTCVDDRFVGGTGVVHDNPIFMTAAGIAEGDYSLQPNSPCVNAGRNAYAVGAVDLNDNDRIYGTRVDMGAFEWQGDYPAINLVFDMDEDKGWTSPVFVTKTRGSSVAMNEFKEGDTIYLRYGVRNSASLVDVHDFKVRFTLSSNVVFEDDWRGYGIHGGELGWIGDWCPEELQSLAAGSYTLECKIIAAEGMVETDATDNEFTINFVVKSEQPVVYGITYENLCGATHGNPETYAAGDVIVFTPPSGRTGYTFTGWTPASITAGMTGAKTVTAGWRANTYQIEFDANGGIGNMSPQTFTYDVGQNLRQNVFVRDGYEFLGWAWTPTDETPQFVDGELIKNLVEIDNSKLTFFAVWTALQSDFVITDGVLTEYTGKGGDIVIPAGVTSIGDEAFLECDSLTSVTIPSGVASIGDYAFESCTSLKSVAFSSGLISIGMHAFHGCSSLTSMELPNSVTSIGMYAFRDCDALSSVAISSSLTAIGDYAFSSCDGLTEIVVDAGNTAYCSENGILYNKAKTKLIQCPGAKSGHVTIPLGVIRIGECAFEDCVGLTSVTIPSGVTHICSDAFEGCCGLSSVTIPSSVTYVGWNSFANCTGLKSVTIPDGVTYIGLSAFEGCSGLMSVTIPSSVTEVDLGAFANCEGLMEILVDEGNTAYCSEDGVLYNKSKTELIQCPGGISGVMIIPQGVASIWWHAFEGCRSLNSVIIPLTVTEINPWAFGWCSGLTSVTIPSGVTDIDLWTFYGCSGLTSVTIPHSVTDIGADAFYDCGELVTVFVDKGDAVRVKSLLRESGFDTTGISFIEVVLDVSTAHGSVQCEGATYNPVSGMYEGAAGKIVSVSVADATVTESDGGTRHVCTGWTGTGSVPASGSASEVTFLMSTVSSLTWNWRTEYKLTLGSPANGKIAGASAGWYQDEASKTLTATPNDGYKFDGWTGDTDGCTVNGNTITVPMSKPRQIGATFVPDVQEQVATPVITPADGSTFSGDSCTVTITCATPGATIYYSINGSSPRMNDQFKYTQPFTITDTTTVKAIAVKDGSTQSEIATAVITKINVETGKWNYDYASAKAFAEENDLPLVVFWTNPGCSHCATMIKAFETQKFLDWQDDREYVFVYSEGDMAVRDLVKNDSGLYPYVAVQWPSQDIDVRFTARDGLMPVTEGDLVDQFTQSVDLSLFGVVLSVESDYGSPVPSVGDHMYMAGSVVTAAVETVVVEPDGRTQHVCVSGEGTGSAPATISSGGVVFEITADSTLVWNWYTQNMLTILEPENGTIGGAESGWFLEDETKTLTATPTGGYKFDGWTGDTDGCTIDGSTITVPTSKPRQIGATFVLDVQEQVATPVITPADGSTFDTDSCTVEITCATEGATIYYSTNGSSPRLRDQFKYTQPFAITGTTTIMAVAVKDGFTQSEVAITVITKVDPPPPTLTSALDEPKLSAVESDGDAEWEPGKDVTAVGGSSARSGEIGMLQRTCLKAIVYGKGTLSFNWKVSCEDDYSGLYTYDHLTFSTVEGGRTNDIAKIDGETEWLPESVTFTTDGPHVILWTYSTDDWEEPGFEDCGWVDNVVWTGDAPPSDIVISDVVTLPKAEVEAFMAKYPSLAAQVGGDAEAFAKLPSATGKLDANGNQMYVWQDIIAGTDPTNPDDKFKIVDIKFEDGELKVTWSPDLNENGTKNIRAYTEFGRKELGGSEKWADMKDVNPAEKNDYKFRKVTVDMP